MGDRWDVNDFLAAEFPPPHPLIEGILAGETANTWAGPPGVGKTWAALAAGLAVGTGRPWLGKFATQRGRVLMVDQESHRFGLQDRLSKLIHDDPSLCPERGQLRVWLPDRALYVDDDPTDPESGFSQLSNECENFRPDVLVLDSQTRIHRVNENDAGAMADVNARLREIIRRFQTAIILIDHTRKPSAMENTTTSDPATRIRGSIEKVAFIDAGLVFDRSKDDDKTMIVRSAKSRWQEAPAPFKVQMDVNGVYARLRYVGEASKDDDTKSSDVVTAIATLEAQLNVVGVTLTEIAGYQDCSEKTADRYCKRAMAAGLILPVSRPSNGGRPKTAYTINRKAD